jgi:hypothetical protein
VTSWPLARVMRQGQLRGFLMQAIPDPFFGPNAAGTRKLRELQFLLYPPRPLWGDIVPRHLDARTRVEVATESSRLMRLLHGNSLVFGDLSMSNVLWAPGSPARIFVIDCDGIRKLGCRPVLTQADTPDWDDPQRPVTGPDIDTDRYKLALLVGRVLAGKAYIRPDGEDLVLAHDVPPFIADKVRPLWKQAAGPRGRRPDASQWLTALSGRVDISLNPAGPVRERPSLSPLANLEDSGSRPVIRLRPGNHPAVTLGTRRIPRPARPVPEPGGLPGHRASLSRGFAVAMAGWAGDAGKARLRSQWETFDVTARPVEATYEYHHDNRRHGDLLQGLGLGPADRLQPRLAAVSRRLGCPDAVLLAAWLPGDRP